jgi:NADPH:quinone reductase-like Zn-dependent oxidoreductase
MTKAVRYDEFGGIEVLRVDDVDRPVPEDGQVLVQVRAAGINPGEAAIRTGAIADIFPSTFPSGQGSDLAGVVAEVGTGVDRFSVGDEVIGFSEKRAAQAELVLVDVDNLTPKPENVSWEVAGGLYVVGVTAWGAVHSVQLEKGEAVVVSAAAGGVGSLAVQLARRAGATVIGLASERNHEWLQSHGVIPVSYGDGVAERIETAAPGGVEAFIDTYGGGYVELALALGVAVERIDTIADFAAAAKYGVKTEPGTDARPGAEVLAELAALIADGHLEVRTRRGRRPPGRPVTGHRSRWPHALVANLQGERPNAHGRSTNGTSASGSEAKQHGRESIIGPRCGTRCRQATCTRSGGTRACAGPKRRYRGGVRAEHHATYDQLLAAASEVIRLDYDESTGRSGLAST